MPKDALEAYRVVADVAGTVWPTLVYRRAERRAWVRLLMDMYTSLDAEAQERGWPPQVDA